MLFRQLFDPVSSTYTYLLADPRLREAILVDPVFEQRGRDAALVRELGLKLLCTVATSSRATRIASSGPSAIASSRSPTTARCTRPTTTRAAR